MALLDLVRCLLLFHIEATCVSMTSTVCLKEEHVTRVCNEDISAERGQVSVDG